MLFTFDIIDASVPTSSDNKALLARSLTFKNLIIDFINYSLEDTHKENITKLIELDADLNSMAI